MITEIEQKVMDNCAAECYLLTEAMKEHHMYSEQWYYLKNEKAMRAKIVNRLILKKAGVL
jgi:hypothetical protein